MIVLNKLSQRGFSLITAIFLLVVLAGLGAIMVTFFGAQQQALAIDVLGSRAYQAARAGIELGAYNISTAAPGAGCAAVPANLAGLQGNLASFTVDPLTCAMQSAVEDGVTINIYTLTATAHNGAAVGSTDRVERLISAVIRQ